MTESGPPLNEPQPEGTSADDPMPQVASAADPRPEVSAAEPPADISQSRPAGDETAEPRPESATPAAETKGEVANGTTEAADTADAEGGAGSAIGEDEPVRELTEAEQRAAALFDRLSAELGDAIVEHAINFGDLVVRVRTDAWRKAGEVARDTLGCDYLSFVAGIDWMPAPTPVGDDAGGDTSAPVQPKEMTFGVAGSNGRFQVFAEVHSTSHNHGVIFKTDVDENDPAVASWTPVYSGADWHERECWEMYGIDFVGHPAMRRLYLPSGFEGNPLRKEFPLLAREVKPWPGLVDVEPMPGDDAGEEESEGG